MFERRGCFRRITGNHTLSDPNCGRRTRWTDRNADCYINAINHGDHHCSDGTVGGDAEIAVRNADGVGDSHLNAYGNDVRRFAYYRPDSHKHGIANLDRNGNGPAIPDLYASTVVDSHSNPDGQSDRDCDAHTGTDADRHTVAHA